MNNPLLSPQIVVEKGQELYDTKLKEKLEKKYRNKYAVIDVETGDYFINDDLTQALIKAKNKYPTHLFYSVKIGSPGIFKMAGATKHGDFQGFY